MVIRKLDQDETQVLNDIESDDFKTVLTPERRAELLAAAERTVRGSVIACSFETIESVN
ncbi:hypothetical protein [Alkalimonas amylolytica]|uniref:Uncharacterized protein n=1 Tax=Alkalimonas amylolytica TaxID=152573 RepID=A0A1H3XFS7_ALKAM|nr:hypothetical protein [Alkalimonas amylolytica]SDZ98193.1 hypothetical protein SAMN04488051_101228 [Alkalimonas amylolytica]